MINVILCLVDIYRLIGTNIFHLTVYSHNFNVLNRYSGFHISQIKCFLFSVQSNITFPSHQSIVMDANSSAITLGKIFIMSMYVSYEYVIFYLKKYDAYYMGFHPIFIWKYFEFSHNGSALCTF